MHENTPRVSLAVSRCKMYVPVLQRDQGDQHSQNFLFYPTNTKHSMLEKKRLKEMKDIHIPYPSSSLSSWSTRPLVYPLYLKLKGISVENLRRNITTQVRSTDVAKQFDLLELFLFISFSFPTTHSCAL